MCWQGPTCAVLQEQGQAAVEQLSFLLLDIHFFSYIHMISMNITAVSQQMKLPQAVKCISIDASQKNNLPSHIQWYSLPCPHPQ